MWSLSTICHHMITICQSRVHVWTVQDLFYYNQILQYLKAFLTCCYTTSLTQLYHKIVWNGWSTMFLPQKSKLRTLFIISFSFDTLTTKKLWSSSEKYNPSSVKRSQRHTHLSVYSSASLHSAWVVLFWQSQQILSGWYIKEKV